MRRRKKLVREGGVPATQPDEDAAEHRPAEGKNDGTKQEDGDPIDHRASGKGAGAGDHPAKCKDGKCETCAETGP